MEVSFIFDVRTPYVVLNDLILCPGQDSGETSQYFTLERFLRSKLTFLVKNDTFIEIVTKFAPQWSNL